MTIFEDRGYAERKAKKLAIQSRATAKKRRAHLNEKWREIRGVDFSFLEPEVSLAVWVNLRRQCIACDPEEVAVTVVAANLELERCSNILSGVDIVHGFCFAYDWETVGAFIVNTRGIGEHLPELMYMFEDDVKFYSHDFTKAFELSGDRTGTGDQLNCLSVGVMGRDWAEKWENRLMKR